MVTAQAGGDRLCRLRKAMADTGNEAVIITKKENCIYLSGYTGSSATLVISQDDSVLITDPRFTEQAEAEAGSSFRIVEYRGDIFPVMARVLSETGAKAVAFEEYDMTCDKYSRLAEALTGNVKVDFKPVKDTITKLRLVKDEKETGFIRRAASIADRAFSHILGFIRPDVRENEIAAEIEYFMRKNGASGPSFDTIAASGPRSSMPHAEASDRAFCIGDAVTLDFGAKCDCYCSDMTRTVFIGKPAEEMMKIYKIVYEAQTRALEGAISGRGCRETDGIARGIITKCGYGPNFGHGLGHGVGLEIHESPRLSEFSDDVLCDGMAVTIEPGIYLPGKGGVRIEDLVIIRGDKPVVLSGSVKEPVVL